MMQSLLRQRLRAIQTIRPARRVFSSKIDDEESVPEKLREDRALNIAQA
jgi:hypothetical protein